MGTKIIKITKQTNKIEKKNKKRLQWIKPTILCGVGFPIQRQEARAFADEKHQQKYFYRTVRKLTILHLRYYVGYNVGKRGGQMLHFLRKPHQ